MDVPRMYSSLFLSENRCTLFENKPNVHAPLFFLNTVLTILSLTITNAIFFDILLNI